MTNTCVPAYTIQTGDTIAHSQPSSPTQGLAAPTASLAAPHACPVLGTGRVPATGAGIVYILTVKELWFAYRTHDMVVRINS